MTNEVKIFETVTALEMNDAGVQHETQAENQGEVILPVPVNAPDLPFHSKFGEPAMKWEYMNENGQVLFYVYRFSLPQDRKVFFPLSLWRSKNGTEEWHWQSLPVPRPLYGLDRLAKAPDAIVLLCEGEKAADAAQEIFPDFVAITSPNGSQSPDKANWQPLTGRKVVIWPDNDAAGQKYAVAAAQLALNAGAVSVSVVNVMESFPEKWDLADEMPSGVTRDDLHRMVMEAQPFLPPPDPLENLVERAKINPGEPFKPDVIDALVRLKASDRPAYELLRAKLRSEKIRVTELDKLIREQEAQDAPCNDENINQADILIDLAGAAELFHTPDDFAYAHFDVNDHRETWPIRHKGFRRWLIRQYHKEMAKAPNAEAINAAINTIEAKAYYESPRQEAFIRVGRHEGKIYIDLCDERWRVIEVGQNGWKVMDSSPVRFRRTAGMLPLPVPVKGGSINMLRDFINVKDNDDFILTAAWLLAAMRETGPYPVLGISGEQGSAKSTFTSLMKRIVDPNSTPLRALPGEDDSLFIAANNGHVLAFDNLSFISPSIADTLCRLSTGGGHAKRQLYTDMDEVLFNFMRPIILNGITDVVTRPDLADRTLVLKLEPIPQGKRKPGEKLLTAFDAAMPEILGALLDALSHGLCTLPQTQLETLPRMADFALWGTACEGAFDWPAGTFMAAYEKNRDILVDSVLDANPVASAIISLMDIGGTWTGTAGELLSECGRIVGEAVQRSRLWPKFPRGMAEHLDRSATFLRQRGIEISKDRMADKSRTRIITISWASDKGGEQSSGSSGQAEASTVAIKTRTKADGPDGHPAGLPAEDKGRVKGFDELDAEQQDGDEQEDDPVRRVEWPL